jgi:N-acetylmuramoyl-L-alanine amidase
MPATYIVNEGDCIASIAWARGLTWRTLWDYPDNQQLKDARQDPNLLYPGDVVHIPDRRARIESCCTDQLHVFKLKGTKVRLRVRLLEDTPAEEAEDGAETADTSTHQLPDFKPQTDTGKGRANIPYLLVVEGVTKSGNTDGDGYLDELISPTARSGRIILNSGTPAEEIILIKIGEMDPAEELNGIRKRLTNLGFPCGDGDERSPEFVAALMLFQECAGLPATGQLDDATRSSLKDAHGS